MRLIFFHIKWFFFSFKLWPIHNHRLLSIWILDLIQKHHAIRPMSEKLKLFYSIQLQIILNLHLKDFESDSVRIE